MKNISRTTIFRLLVTRIRTISRSCVVILVLVKQNALPPLLGNFHSHFPLLLKMKNINRAMYYVILTFYRKYYNYFLKLPYGTSTCKIKYSSIITRSTNSKNTYQSKQISNWVYLHRPNAAANIMLLSLI